MCDFGQAAPLDRRSPSIRLDILTLLYFAGRISYNSPHMSAPSASSKVRLPREIAPSASARRPTSYLCRCTPPSGHCVVIYTRVPLWIRSRTADSRRRVRRLHRRLRVRPWGSRAARRRMTGRDRGTGAPEECGCQICSTSFGSPEETDAGVFPVYFTSSRFRLPVRHLPREMRQSQSNAA